MRQVRYQRQALVQRTACVKVPKGLLLFVMTEHAGKARIDVNNTELIV